MTSAYPVPIQFQQCLKSLLLVYKILTLKAPITTAADNKSYFFSLFFWLDVSNESSARQMIHMKNQTLVSSKDKSKK